LPSSRRSGPLRRVDEDVGRAERVADGARRPGGGGGVRQVRREGEGLGAEGADVGRDAGERLRAAGDDRDRADAPAREREGGRGADAARPAGDDDDLALEVHAPILARRSGAGVETGGLPVASRRVTAEVPHEAGACRAAAGETGSRA
jgi:hypothetical protein